MEYRRFGNDFVLRLNRGEEILTSITEFCERENIKAGSVTGIGAADSARFGLYSVEKREYAVTELHEEAEITALIGNISEMEGKVYLHLHITFARKGGAAIGGHLNEARISATAEIFIHSIEGQLDRSRDVETGLNLITFE